MRIETRAPLRIDLAGAWSDIPPFSAAEGGAVLNVAIAQYVAGSIVRDDGAGGHGFHLSYGLDMPTGGGLGSSASLSVAWLALVHAAMGETPDQKTLARKACDLASVLGITGGKQDEYAAALGGVNLMHFGAGHAIEVTPLDLTLEVGAALERRLVLCYTGQPRLSKGIHDRVWDAYEKGDRAIAATLSRLRDLALMMSDALLAGDFHGVAEALDENWACQRRLDDSITNPAVDEVFALARAAGALAGKACGAGGGGCLAFLTPDGDAPHVRAALADVGVTIIDATIDWDGVTMTMTED